ncbi:MAG: YeeE/YedE thiosulfate transporter family protein [Flavobacteriaceae bacterium]|nr:YeeE/YedE thiosulfate transporter family protein [Flavobacteriaceae bacterium]
MRTIVFFGIGIFFGITLFKSEAASWFRIYEMFQFQSFHMYGIIGSALLFGMLFTFLLKRLNANSLLDGKPLVIPDKDKSWKRYLYGGTLFGVGWALTGACPGPLFVLLGAGFIPVLVVIAAALIGTYAYGALRSKLPH